jgi:hypothetical protein
MRDWGLSGGEDVSVRMWLIGAVERFRLAT